jgi:hypothetical protein
MQPVPTNPRFRDETGQVHGQLKVIAFAYSAESRAVWLCRCACGNEIEVAGKSLRSGHTRSCGCLRQRLAAQLKKKHGKVGTPEYRAWKMVKQRCTNPNLPDAANYYYRGIRMCPRWAESFEAFLEDMGPRPTDGHSIERKDVNGDYTPGNCCWATSKEQNRNRRSNRVLTLRGKSQPLAAWAEDAAIPSSALSSRLKRGWPLERAIFTPYPARTGPRPKPR